MHALDDRRIRQVHLWCLKVENVQHKCSFCLLEGTSYSASFFKMLLKTTEVQPHVFGQQVRWRNGNSESHKSSRERVHAQRTSDLLKKLI